MSVTVNLIRNGIYSKEWEVEMSTADDSSVIIAHGLEDKPLVWLIPIEVLASEIKSRKLQATPTIGVNGAYGSVITLSPSEGYECFLIPRTILVNFDGTFGTGETVTVRFTLNWQNSGSTNFTISNNATGVVEASASDIDGVIVDEDKLLSIAIDASSNLASTSVTVSVSITVDEVGKKGVYLEDIDENNITVKKTVGSLPIRFRVLALAHSLIKEPEV